MSEYIPADQHVSFRKTGVRPRFLDEGGIYVSRAGGVFRSHASGVNGCGSEEVQPITSPLLVLSGGERVIVECARDEATHFGQHGHFIPRDDASDYVSKHWNPFRILPAAPVEDAMSAENAIACVTRALANASYPCNVNGANEREVSLSATAGLKALCNALETERTMHAAWRKRAEEAEAATARAKAGA